MKKVIPNCITSINLFSGCVSITLAFAGYQYLWLAALLIFVAALLDYFDGMAARTLKAYSELGKQLDSLADLVSFGIAPSVIVFQLLNISLGKLDSSDVNSDFFVQLTGLNAANHFITYSIKDLVITFSAFIIAIFSAIRLAKFNIDTRQTSSFIGLPTPANAILFASLPLILHFGHSKACNAIITNTYVLLFLVIVQSALMVAEIPLFSLKMKSLKWHENKTRYIFISISLLLLLFLHFKAIPLVVVLYIVSSLVSNMVCKKARTA